MSEGTATDAAAAVTSSISRGQQQPQQQPQQQQQLLSLRKSSNSSSSSSCRRLRPFLLVVAAAVTTTIGIVWTVTQQYSISIGNTSIISKSSLLNQDGKHNNLFSDVWLPEATVERVRNASAVVAAASAIFPLPRFTKETVVILVMSARKHQEHRNAIRTTWAMGHDNVYFLLAAPCPYPPSQRTSVMECKPIRENNNENDEENQEYSKRLKREHEYLLREQSKHHDLIYLPNVTESYRGLPQKLKEGYDWVLQQFDYRNNYDGSAGIRWLVKVDDDTVVRVSTLQHLLSRFNADIPMVIGRIIPRSPVWRDGKWAEFPNYKRQHYPYWAQGSCGHVVSRPVAQFLAHYKHDLFNYQGEDTSLGIWLDEAPAMMRNRTMWIHTPYFINDGDCTNPDWIIMGHEITAQKMKDCYYQHGDEVQLTRAWHDQRAEFSPNVDFVPPRPRQQQQKQQQQNR